MARPLNYSRAAERDRMARNGVDRIDDFGVPPEFYSPPRLRQSKADMRADLAAAMASVTRIVKCRCGHSATVALPPARLGAKLRCSRCGKIANGPGNEKGRHHEGVGPKS